MTDEEILAVPNFVPAAAKVEAPAVAPKPTLEERVAELQKRKALREAAAEIERTAAKVERLELEEKFEKETGGALDRAFVIVDVSDLGEGFVVLKLGTDVEWNTFKASKMNVVDLDVFLTPNVLHPSLDQFRMLAKRRAFVPERCASALASLYGVKSAVDAGK
jgi:hypothetical protein